jgi:hypothetical protein
VRGDESEGFGLRWKGGGETRVRVLVVCGGRDALRDAYGPVEDLDDEPGVYIYIYIYIDR